MNKAKLIYLILSLSFIILAWSRSLKLGATQDDILFLHSATFGVPLSHSLRGYLWPDYFRPLSTTGLYEFLLLFSSGFLSISFIGHLLNLLLFCIAIGLLMITDMRTKSNFIVPFFIYTMFALSPAFAMPFGWVSGFMDIFWIFLASMLVLIISQPIFKKGVFDDLLVLGVCSMLIATKETGFLLVASLYLVQFRRRRWRQLLLLTPLVVISATIYTFLSSTLGFDLGRPIDLLRIFLQTYSTNKFTFVFFLFYFTCLVVVILYRVSKGNVGVIEEFLWVFLLFSNLVFVFSARPQQLSSYYFIPSFWAISLLAVKASNQIRDIPKLPKVILCVFSALLLFSVSMVIRSYPSGLASASEFQSTRTMSTYKFLTTNRNSTISLCTPEQSVLAALGGDTFLELYFPDVTFGNDDICNAIWTGTEWRFK
jgi:hypothetical protein